MTELAARERIILAIDTSDEIEAQRLAIVAKEAGARFVKLGLELQTATSWRYCSELAAEYDLGWVADAKLDDISNTVEKAVYNISEKEHPPFGITMHVKSGLDSMRKAQAAAGNIIMFGVTELTSIPETETEMRYGVTRHAVMAQMEEYGVTVADFSAVPDELLKSMYTTSRLELVKRLAEEAVEGTLKGVVVSPKEVGAIKSDPYTAGLFAMIPGVRSASAESHDQSNVGTPAAAIRSGADLLVIGRQITEAADPAYAYEELVAEIEEEL